MLGVRQPLDGPVFERLEDAENWCIHAMISHYDRRLGMSDARIEPFKSGRLIGLPDHKIHNLGDELYPA